MVLNYPVGETHQEGLELDKLQPANFLASFFSSKFSGYIVLTIEGYSGMEEGVLFFREGNPVGAAFSFDNYNVAVFGDAALDAVLNSFAAKRGIVDVFRLSKQQIDLVLALDERTSLQKPPPKESLPKRIPAVYDQTLAQQALKGFVSVLQPSSSLLKKIGLGELAK